MAAMSSELTPLDLATTSSLSPSFTAAASMRPLVFSLALVEALVVERRAHDDAADDATVRVADGGERGEHLLVAGAVHPHVGAGERPSSALSEERGRHGAEVVATHQRGAVAGEDLAVPVDEGDELDGLARQIGRGARQLAELVGGLARALEPAASSVPALNGSRSLGLVAAEASQRSRTRPSTWSWAEAPASARGVSPGVDRSPRVARVSAYESTPTTRTTTEKTAMSFPRIRRWPPLGYGRGKAEVCSADATPATVPSALGGSQLRRPGFPPRGSVGGALGGAPLRQTGVAPGDVRPER